MSLQVKKIFPVVVLSLLLCSCNECDDTTCPFPFFYIEILDPLGNNLFESGKLDRSQIIVSNGSDSIVRCDFVGDYNANLICLGTQDWVSGTHNFLIEIGDLSMGFQLNAEWQQNNCCNFIQVDEVVFYRNRLSRYDESTRTLKVFLSESDLNESLDSKDYFPLGLGNYWEFDNGSGFIATRSIDRIEIIDGHDYYRMISHRDTVYYRKSGGNIYMKKKGKPEAVLIKFDASVGDQWTFEDSTWFGSNWDSSESIWNVNLLSTSETLKLGVNTFDNCYLYAFSNSCYECGYFTWLGPGLGVIQESYSGLLKKAKINGVTFNF